MVVVWINRFNKTMYKRPLIPCDIEFRYLFSKFMKRSNEDDLEEHIQANQVVVSSKIVPDVDIHDRKVASVVETRVVISKSRFLSKDMIQINTFDPSNVLLSFRRGGKSTSRLLTPTWFGKAMVKL